MVDEPGLEAGADAPPVAAAAVEDGPLSVRVESKSWKTRMDAFDELAKVLSLALLSFHTPVNLRYSFIIVSIQTIT